MGDNNSSKKRVCPLMNEIIHLQNVKDSIFNLQEVRNKIIELLNLMNNGYQGKHKIFNDIGNIKDICYDGCSSTIKINEKSLAPTKERLIWLVEHFKQTNANNKQIWIDKLVGQRKDLFNNDRITIDQANVKIEKLYKNINVKLPKKWWVLEGNSQPDIFIETDKYIFVAEAKWTEKHFTKHTTWDNDRVQLVRHIEGALNYEKLNRKDGHQKEVFSFYILSDKFLKIKGNEQDLDDTKNGDKTMWDDSLKHKSSQEIEEIKKTYIGYTTWDEITSKLGIKFDE